MIQPVGDIAPEYSPAARSGNPWLNSRFGVVSTMACGRTILKSVLSNAARHPRSRRSITTDCRHVEAAESFVSVDQRAVQQRYSVTLHRRQAIQPESLIGARERSDGQVHTHQARQRRPPALGLLASHFYTNAPDNSSSITPRYAGAGGTEVAGGGKCGGDGWT